MAVLKTLLAVSVAAAGAQACAGKNYRPAGNMMRRQDQLSATVAPVGGIVAATAPPSSVPLNSIFASMLTVSVPLPATPTAGQQPAITNAPTLPQWSYTPGAYPTMDVTPPTDSDEVKAWVAAIDWTKVPSYSPNVANSGESLCTVNAAGAADKSRCWWSCGQCTDKTDIVECSEKDTWGLTFDDGPSVNTPILLDYLGDNNLKATFYVIGSRALGQPDILRQEHIDGHELGGHTWSHPPLTTLTNEQIVAELGWTRKLIKDITGVTTLTFRPPQGDIDNRVRAIAAQMNLQAVMWTGVGDNNELLFDTQDFDVAAGLMNATEAFSQWTAFLDTNLNKIDNGFISLEHDLYPTTVDLAVYHILPNALSRTNPTLSLKSVQECHGRSIGESYLETAQNFIFGNSTTTSGEVTGSQALPGASSTSGAVASASSGAARASSGAAGAASSVASGAQAAQSSAAATSPGSAGFAQVAVAGSAWAGVLAAGVALLI